MRHYRTVTDERATLYILLVLSSTIYTKLDELTLPIGLVQWNFKAYYLYGAVAPQTGENLWLEFSHLDGQCFQIFLDNLAAEYPEHLNVV